MKTLTIDCNVKPYTSPGYTVEEHQKDGCFIFTPSAITLHLEAEQKSSCLSGFTLRERLRKLPTLNACVLDYLLTNPRLIPDSWKGKYIFFWGTIYRDSDGDLCVRDLYLGGDRWQWGCYWLEGDWTDRSPAALRASLPAEASA